MLVFNFHINHLLSQLTFLTVFLCNLFSNFCCSLKFGNLKEVFGNLQRATTWRYKERIKSWKLEETWMIHWRTGWINDDNTNTYNWYVHSNTFYLLIKIQPGFVIVLGQQPVSITVEDHNCLAMDSQWMTCNGLWMGDSQWIVVGWQLNCQWIGLAAKWRQPPESRVGLAPKENRPFHFTLYLSLFVSLSFQEKPPCIGHCKRAHAVFSTAWSATSAWLQLSSVPPRQCSSHLAATSAARRLQLRHKCALTLFYDCVATNQSNLQIQIQIQIQEKYKTKDTQLAADLKMCKPTDKTFKESKQ